MPETKKSKNKVQAALDDTINALGGDVRAINKEETTDDQILALTKELEETKNTALQYQAALSELDNKYQKLFNVYATLLNLYLGNINNK